MQQFKDIKTIQETGEYCSDSTLLTKMFQTILKKLFLSYINSILSKLKLKGINGKLIFQNLFLLKFIDFKNIRQLIVSGYSKEMEFADLGVDWELFISKIINNGNSIQKSIKNSFDCLFSIKTDAA
jgi:hypothetical protein